jgi:hypothetical protein
LRIRCCHLLAACLLNALIFASSSSFAQIDVGRIVAKLDSASLHLTYSVSQGGGRFAVLDSDAVALAEGKELLILRNNLLQRKVDCGCRIDCLSLDRQGSGAIVCDKVVFLVTKLKIDPAGVEVRSFWSDRGGFITRVLLDDDSLFTITPNARMIICTNIEGLRSNRYTVLTDTLSRYIAQYSNSYLGTFGSEYFFSNFSGEEGAARLWTMERQNGLLDTARIMDLGYLGEIQSMWGPPVYDKTRSLFYVATLQDGCLVIREFNIRDFIPGN